MEIVGKKAFKGWHSDSHNGLINDARSIGMTGKRHSED
jgi:hypothetical protein